MSARARLLTLVSIASFWIAGAPGAAPASECPCWPTHQFLRGTCLGGRSMCIDLPDGPLLRCYRQYRSNLKGAPVIWRHRVDHDFSACRSSFLNLESGERTLLDLNGGLAPDQLAACEEIFFQAVSQLGLVCR